eukprot:gene6777-6994_t
MPNSRSSSGHPANLPTPDITKLFASHQRKMMQAASSFSTTENGSISINIPTVSTTPDITTTAAADKIPNNSSTASSDARVGATINGEAANITVPVSMVSTAGPPDQLAGISQQPAALAPAAGTPAPPPQQVTSAPPSVPGSTRESCLLPAEVGPCRASIPRWAHSPAAAGCISFIWGGCQGNANNFRSYEECRAACGPLTGAGSNSTSTTISSSTAPRAGQAAVTLPAPAPAPDPAPAPQQPPVAMPVTVLPDKVVVNGSTQPAAQYAAQQAAASKTSSASLATSRLWKITALMLVTAAVAL